MKRTLLLLAAFFIISPGNFQSSITAQQNSISFNFISPAGGLSDTNLNIAVVVNSLYQLSSVKAKVEDRETNLAFSTCAYRNRFNECQPGWAGMLSLEGLARGLKQMTVTATDVFNTVATSQISFTYDQPPKIIFSGLPDEFVARPNIKLKVDCVDDDPAGCRGLVAVMSNGNFVAQLPNQFDGELSLDKSNGAEGDFCLRATDSAFQVREVCQKLYVEASPVLTEVLSVNGKILDIQPDRALVAERRNGREVVKIFSLTSGQETEITTLTNSKLPTVAPYRTAALSPKGAIFMVDPDDGVFNKMFEWRDGELLDLGNVNSSTSFEAAGNYAMWARNEIPDQTASRVLLILRDLNAGTNREIIMPFSIGNTENSLTADGEVVFWGGSNLMYHIFRYRDGQTPQLTNLDNVRDVYPMTDGQNIVFRRLRGSVSSPDYEFILLTEAGEQVLASGTGNLPGNTHYLVNNGWTAFSKPGNNGNLPVWLRSPEGETVQKTFFQSPTFVDSLNSDGKMTVVSYDLKRRYFPLTNHPPIEISTPLGHPFWQDGKLFLVIGRSLFQFTPPANVSAASYSETSLAAESITAVFGSRLATETQVSTAQPLPTMLAGTTVSVRDSGGVERLAPLFFVSRDQINYLIPQNTAAGTALISITSGDGAKSSSTAQIASVAPGFFTANASGRGVPAATLLRVKANGEQIYEPIAEFDQMRNQFVPRAIDFGPESDQLFLILFGTGFRYRSSLSAASAVIGGTIAEVVFAGAQGDFTGLDQANIRLPRNLAGRGDTEIALTIDGKPANTVTINIR